MLGLRHEDFKVISLILHILIFMNFLTLSKFLT